MNVFVYGTLLFPPVAERVAGIVERGKPATLFGYRRFEAKTRTRGNYPAIVPAVDASVDGLVYCNVTAGQLERLDAFEFIEGRLYSRKIAQVEVEHGGLEVAIYVADQGLFDCLLEPMHRAWNPVLFQENELEWFIEHQL